MRGPHSTRSYTLVSEVDLLRDESAVVRFVVAPWVASVEFQFVWPRSVAFKPFTVFGEVQEVVPSCADLAADCMDVPARPAPLVHVCEPGVQVSVLWVARAESAPSVFAGEAL